MAKCEECGTKFNVDDARSEFDEEFPEDDIDYDELYEGGLCGSCAASQASSNMNAGRAIDMMNGDEDYDDDFVQAHL